MNRQFLRFHPVPFLALYFALTWVPMWLAVASARWHWPIPPLLFQVLGGLGAPAAALIMVYRSGDVHLVRDYWDRLLNPRRMRAPWWPVTLFTVPALMVAAVALSTLLGESWEQLAWSPRFRAGPLLFTVILLFFGPIPEELGLRGYGTDSLCARTGVLQGSLILGALWSLWHLPLVFLPGSYQNQLLRDLLLTAAYFSIPVSWTIIMHWIFYRTHRSTLSAILFHAAGNFAGEAWLPGDTARIIQAMLLLLVAAAVVMADGRTFRSRPAPFSPQEPHPTWVPPEHV
ncbi:MAG: CPBP family intramembrane metalloprotease [Anaerolineae bacterium]|nr:CPBP family intramembrane metalloprotease [Anaerolineae bacterium]